MGSRPPACRIPHVVAAALGLTLVAATAVAADADGPLAEEHLGGTARPVRFVEPAGPAPEESGAVWFLTLSSRRLSWVDRAVGKDRPRVVTADAAGPFDADDAFAASQQRGREVATRLDPAARTVVGEGVRAGELAPGDEIVGLGDQGRPELRRAERLVQQWKLVNGRCGGCGEPLGVTVARSGELVHLRVPVPRPRERAVSVPLARRPSVPLPEIGDVSGGTLNGPSAGLAFALAYLDRLASGQLLAGRQVAATGVLLDDFGSVGAVSGVLHKIEAAVAAGADVVFVPVASEDDVPPRPEVPVVPVRDVRDALWWLCTQDPAAGCGPHGAALGGLGDGHARAVDDLWLHVPAALGQLRPAGGSG